MIKIHALHGFLGLSSDWKVFDLPNLHAHDLASGYLGVRSDGFWGWAKRFNQQVFPEQDIILGYSLGGRLALHALLDQPQQWRAAIIVSAHPGYNTGQEKTTRLRIDKWWAGQFENEPWEQVLSDWNAQSIFQGRPFPFSRQEHQFARKNLSEQLKTWSLGVQENLSDAIRSVQIPILWICGDLDIKFKNICQKLLFTHRQSRIKIVDDAWHRVPWERPEIFIQLIKSFIQEVTSCS